MTLLEYYLSALWLRACYLACALLPFRGDKVVFASARATSLEGNLLYLYREMQRQRPDLHYVTLLERYSYSFLGKVQYLLRLTKGAYHVATARLVVIDNAYLPVHVGPHRKRTLVVQVWHAAGALKKFGLDIAAPQRAVENRFVHKYYDYVVVGSEFAVAPYASALRTDPAHVVPLGTARTDLLHEERALAAVRQRFFEEHPGLLGKRIALYAPTFRGHGTGKRPGGALDAIELRSMVGPEWALVHKTHPVFAPTDAQSQGYDVMVADEYDLNELFAVADVFITDYSSAVFEWVTMRKPLVLFADDLEDYERDPGFYLDFRREMVGEIVSSTQEVAALLVRDEWDLGDYDAFIARHCPLDDGHASRRVTKFLLEKSQLSRVRSSRRENT